MCIMGMPNQYYIHNYVLDKKHPWKSNGLEYITTSKTSCNLDSIVMSGSTTQYSSQLIHTILGVLVIAKSYNMLDDAFECNNG
jgi:hypothetical protein